MEPQSAWNRGVQQDAQEFLAALRDQHPPIASATSIRCNQHVKCTKCCTVSTSIATLEELPLCMPSTRTDLSSLIDNHFMPESVTNTCVKCQEDAAETSLEITTPPRILVIQLKRFVFDLKTLQSSKLNTMIDCPLKGLRLPGVDATFDLIGTVEHGGSLSGGHYWAHVFDPMSEVWFNFNDSSATIMDEDSVVTPGTYLLFYALKP
jgi:ubiquitin C-terminal hydrolase